MIGAALFLLAAQAAPMIDSPVVPDPELATMRGGFRLPNGIDVSLTVQTQTAIDGAVVLRTVFKADQGAPTLTIYAPHNGERVAAGEVNGATNIAASSTGPRVWFDPRTGIHIQPSAAVPSVAITTGTAGAQSESLSGLDRIVPGAITATDAGTITQNLQGPIKSVELRGADLSILHFAGNAFGSAITNTGNDRAIDTITNLSIDLRNAGPDVLGSAMLRVQDLATDAAILGAR